MSRKVPPCQKDLSKMVRFKFVFGVSGRSENSPAVPEDAVTNEVIGESKEESHSRIDNAEYERMKKAVSRHASPSCIKKNGCVVQEDLKNKLGSENLKTKYEVALLVGGFLKKHKEDLSRWKAELMQEGVVIVPDVFHTKDIQENVEELFRTMRISHRRFIENLSHSPWENIRNAAKKVASSDQRYQTKFGAYWWLKKHCPEKLALKLKIDLFMASLVEALGIAGAHGQHEIPRFGSTILLSAPGCAEQIPHTDYCTGYHDHTDDSSPAYFLMFGGKNGMHLNVWRRSYLTSLVDLPELSNHLGETFKKETVYVPPNAIIISRGDLVHSGTAYPRSEKMAGVRYHLQFNRYRLPVGDVFEIRNDFVQNKVGDLTLRGSSAGKKRTLTKNHKCSRRKRNRRT